MINLTVDTRFNNAVGHLGNENHTVVLGGIHALHQIAVEHESYTQVVHNLFCSYLRENSAKLYEEVDFEKNKKKCPVIIQTLLNYLFSPYNGKNSVYGNYTADLSFSTLGNYDFYHLTDCNFSNALLTNCNFSEASLTKCNFDYATLTECSFIEAVLTKCYLDSATLIKCGFIPKEPYFNSAQLFDCDVEYAELINTKLPPNKKTQSETEN